MVVLDDEGLESALPDSSGRGVLFVIPADVGSKRPVHPAREIAVQLGLHNQMDVIRHQARRQDR